MARKLASIVTIASCDPIPETERLSVATMEGNGWKVVTGRDEFVPGDSALYFEIDSYLPADDVRYGFLKDRCLRKFTSKAGKVLREGLRIKTAKLRGVISQGLLMPLAGFPELIGKNVGDDVTEDLNVKKYDEMVEIYAPKDNSALNGDAMGEFPSLICKTDEDRIQIHPEYFDKLFYRAFEVTEKNDGSSCTMAWSPTIDPENPFMVCSRNKRLKRESAAGKVSTYWQVAEKIEAQNAIEYVCKLMNRELAFQGELVGPGVNGNRDLYKEHEWHVFKIWDIGQGRYLLPMDARMVCEKAGFTYVPVMATGMLVFQQFKDMDALLKFAEGKTARGNEREGLVFKSVDEPYVTFKAVSNRYLLKEE